MKKLSVFKLGGASVLGKLNEGVITGISCGSRLVEQDFVNYFIAEMRGELEDTVIGLNSSFSQRKLTGKEKISFKVVKLQVKEAKKQGDSYLLKNVLDELRGKN